MLEKDQSPELQQQVITAIEQKQPLTIIGGGSKLFYGHTVSSSQRPLHTGGHIGIIAYEPSELVITVRAGTPLVAVEALLAEHQQELPFEPPHFDGQATIGGCVAAGLSGPRRFRTGAVRDSLLGVKLINGKGQILNVGGRVMKNVAGYDLSRLMAGAMGTLGLLLEVSLKLRARSSHSLTLQHQVNPKAARQLLRDWYQLPGILSATSYHQGIVSIRLSGSKKTLSVMKNKIGGEPLKDDDEYWHTLKNQQFPFFKQTPYLWRVAVPPMAPTFSNHHETWEEWGGGLRWIAADLDNKSKFREQALIAGGHATLFKDTSGLSEQKNISRFQPLAPPLMALHHSLKQSLDPHGIFNPGRLFKEL